MSFAFRGRSMPANKPEMIVHGVDPVIDETQAQQIAFAVRCTIHCITDDHGTIPAARPLYEVPLLKRMYSRKGGEVQVSEKWLYHPKKKSQSLFEREIPLTRMGIALEMERLQKSYSYMTQAGKQSDFDKVYGVGVNNRFKKTVIEMAKAWNRLKAKCLADDRAPTRDELEAIARLGEPEVEGEADLEVVPLDDSPAASDTPIMEDADDPIADLQNFFVEKGQDPEIALNVARLHSEGRVDVDSLKQVSILAQKTEAIKTVIRLYNEWGKAREAQKAP